MFLLISQGMTHESWWKKYLAGWYLWVRTIPCRCIFSCVLTIHLDNFGSTSPPPPHFWSRQPLLSTHFHNKTHPEKTWSATAVVFVSAFNAISQYEAIQTNIQVWNGYSWYMMSTATDFSGLYSLPVWFSCGAQIIGIKPPHKKSETHYLGKTCSNEVNWLKREQK